MSTMVPDEAFAIQELVQLLEKDLADPSLYQPPGLHAAQAAYDAAAYYEQLALMLEAENLAFNMARCFPCVMPDEQAFAVGKPDVYVPQAPPGLKSVAPPPGLGPPSMGGSSGQLAEDAMEPRTRQICWFQNRYLHSKPEDKVSPCSKGDDCLFCHAFHPKVTRRDGPKSRCSCASNFKNHQQQQQQQEHSPPSDTASTGLGDDCFLEPSSSDESTEMPPSTESPPMLRQICWFQNRWHNSEDGDSFKPCSKGDDCFHCHEVHPKIKRRNDRTSTCTCPRHH